MIDNSRDIVYDKNMKVIKRMQRDQDLLTFLATPAKNISGDYFKDDNGNFVYPTLRDASAGFDISEERISRIKNKDLNKFNQLKEKISKEIIND